MSELARVGELRDRRSTLQTIIKLGREAEHGPLGAHERAEVHASIWRAEQELEQVELEIAKGPRDAPRCPTCDRVMSNREAAEQGACNDCNGGAWEGPGAGGEV